MGWPQLRDSARRRHGVFTPSEALHCGVSRGMLRTLTQHGVIERAHQGVYVIAGQPSFEQRVMAACVATSGRASHWTAARLWGLQGVPGEPVSVLTPWRGSARPRDGIVVHSSRLGEPRIVRSGIPVTSAARTLVDVAGLPGTTDAQILVLFGHLLATRATTFERLEARIAAVGANVAGLGRARQVMDRVGGGIESVAEAELAWLLGEWGVPPSVAQFAVRAPDGRLIARVDRAWPQQRVVLELDGQRYHSGPEAFERDRVRQNALMALGWRVVRATPTLVRERSATLRDDLRALLEESDPEAYGGCWPAL